MNNITYTNVTNIVNNETCYIKNDTYLNITNITNNITNIFQNITNITNNITNIFQNITNNYINITKVNNTTILNNITNTNTVNITICCEKNIIHNETVDNATVAGATNISPQNGFYSSLSLDNIQLKKAGFNIWGWLILLFLIMCIILIKTEQD